MKRNVLFLVVSLVAVAASARADERWVTIAAAASTAEARAAADFACTGTNDEVTIQKAIDLCKKNGKQLFLFCGLYRDMARQHRFHAPAEMGRHQLR